MGRRINRVFMTNLKCEDCSNIFKIPRKRGETREKGHTKHVWCYKCKKITAHKDFHNEYDIIGAFALNKEELSGFKQ